MGIYIINLFMTTFINYLSRLSKNKYMSFALTGMAVLFAGIIAGFRDTVGTDFQAYEDWFNYYLTAPFTIKDPNPGFNLMIKVVQFFTSNSQGLFFISALITYALVMDFIRKNTELYDLGFYLFITLYLYYSSLNIMRQWIAISIFLFSIQFIYQKKFIKYTFCIFVAASFHMTAILFIPLYFITKLKPNLKNIMVLIAAGVFAGSQFKNIIIFIGRNIKFINTSKYIDYFNTSFATSGGGGWAYFAIVFMIFLLMMIYRKKYIEEIENGAIHIILICIVMVLSLFVPFNMIFSRIQLYLMPMTLISLPNIVKLMDSKGRVLVAFVILSFGLLYMYRALLINGGEPLPYQSVLFYC